MGVGWGGWKATQSAEDARQRQGNHWQTGRRGGWAGNYCIVLIGCQAQRGEIICTSHKASQW